MNPAVAVSAHRRVSAHGGRTLLLALGLALAAPLPGPGALADDKPPATYTIPLPPIPDFSTLDWLVGDWQGPIVGKHDQGEVRLSVAYTLNKRFMLLHGSVSQPATKTAPSTQETWMGVLGPSGKDSGLTLRLYSNTGFSSSYQVTVNGNEVDFNPAGGNLPAGWLFRRHLERVGEAALSDTLEVAPPAKDFFKYYTAQLHRMPPKENPLPKETPSAKGNSTHP